MVEGRDYMTKAKVLGTSLVCIVIEALLPVPGPLTVLSVYILFAKPIWFKTAIDCFYEP
jgi:hypothetical protein